MVGVDKISKTVFANTAEELVSVQSKSGKIFPSYCVSHGSRPGSMFLTPELQNV